MIKIERVYNSKEKGFKILVDRIWPRGIKKDSINLWMKEIAPSNELRKWFSHDVNKWEEFKRKYIEELKTKKDLIMKIKELEREKGTIILVYGAKDEEHNQAIILKEYLEKL
ncbi:MAG: DUF488 family protein [Candidatus Rehaiarchaeum fermentans]|nr:DUF488 family protein [Candidatus Rehaiarchaeum fermentans]